MANTNITIRIDEDLKIQLQGLLADLGMDVTTFFTLAAKQAVREQALPFQPRMLSDFNRIKAYHSAISNTVYDSKGRAMISKDDEWIEEKEWDELFKQMKEEKGIEKCLTKERCGS